ncbi:hypothetical protein CAPTEDRAFT_222105 [Capitella teleta]|uniref:Vinculin n=1 Tax=Capitella teleta TaxID=283909 RepID=R7VBY1_CAPTE|nr:hypothetical protein CAPTEDRAFT_222105 [Capitella teleta]|eukprot:ELU13816.1 hypothetical protein CAPTEDRAFT_222105 [Capitella teleta]
MESSCRSDRTTQTPLNIAEIHPIPENSPLPYFESQPPHEKATLCGPRVVLLGSAQRSPRGQEVIEASMWLSAERDERKKEQRRMEDRRSMVQVKHNGDEQRKFMQCIYLLSPNQEPPAAAPCSAADVSYKELKSLPTAKHTTPERPSQNSGFRMTPRPLSTSRFGESPIVTKDLDRWEDEDNEIVSVAKEIGQNLHNMIDFTKSGGPIKNKEGLIMSAKTIAKDGEKLHRFASILGRYCVDKRVAEDLRCAADFVPTVTAQLNILASVKAATSDDVTAHKMLIKTGKNLAEAINKMLKCAEACCVKGLKQPPSDAIGDAEAVVLASKWRHRLDRHRAHETLTAATDSLGLRRVSHAQSGPVLTQITLSESKVDQ